MTRLLLAAAVLSLWGCSCETVDSGDIKTSGLYADLEAEATGNGRTQLKASLTLGQGSLTYLRLAEGETLVASSGATSKTMSRTTLFGATWYEAELATDAADAPFTIALTRVADTSAPSSTVTLPRPFTLTAPAANQVVSRAGGPLQVTWQVAGSGDELRLSASGPCINSVSELTLSDSGAHQLPAFSARTDEAATTCNVVVKLARLRHGTVDPAYGKGGDFVARVTRQVAISSTP